VNEPKVLTSVEGSTGIAKEILQKTISMKNASVSFFIVIQSLLTVAAIAANVPIKQTKTKTIEINKDDGTF
jgi:hypothetical protein